MYRIGVIINGKPFAWLQEQSKQRPEKILGKIFSPVSQLLHRTPTIQAIPKRAFDANVPEPSELPSEAKPMDIAEVYDSGAMQVVEQAFSLAKQFSHAQVDALHLFLAALSDQSATFILSRLGMDVDKLQESLRHQLTLSQLGESTILSDQAEQILVRAFLNAYANCRQVVNAFEIFCEAFEQDEYVQQLFLEQGVTKRQFVNMICWVRDQEKLRERMDAGTHHLLVGRENEVKEVFRILENGHQSIVLVGSPGTGKQSILEGIVTCMVEERVPKNLKGKRWTHLSMRQILTDIEPHQAPERFMALLVQAWRTGQMILMISDIEILTENLLKILMDHLSHSSSIVIATTTPHGYASVVEKSALGRVLEKIKVQEPDVDQAICILESKIHEIESMYQVFFTYQAIESIVQLCDRYIYENYLPNKAIEFAKEIALRVENERGKGTTIMPEDIGRLISEKTGILTAFLTKQL